MKRFLLHVNKILTDAQNLHIANETRLSLLVFTRITIAAALHCTAPHQHRTFINYDSEINGNIFTNAKAKSTNTQNP